MSRIAYILFFTILLSASGLAQNYELNYSEQPLNEVLIELGRQYDFQFSFNDQLLSQYTITLNRQFASKHEVIAFLLKDLPLDFELSGEVFVIFPKVIELPPVIHQLSGQVMEIGTQEVLPFSHVLINDYGTVTDLKGSFSYSSTTDSVFHVKASHLGCYVLDTVLYAGTNQKVYLTPAAVGIPEIIVQNNIVEKSAQVGESPGLTKLNPYIANYLPGNGDNSVFNLLRLQPGILAAGEQPNDLIIWGSPEGTSRVFFDGFTIWGLKNFSDNISAVNPYLAKNVHVSKGGYDATHEDVVGGIVNITGKNGSTQQSGFNFFVNNQTVNGMMEVPLFKTSSLILAFRKTYNDLFSGDDLRIYGSQSNAQGQAETDILPDYEFRDFNVKYTLHGDNGDLFYVSFLGAKDHFAYDAERELNNNSVFQSSQEDNTQSGATIYYGKNWQSGTRSHFKMSYSALKSAYDLNRDVENRWNGKVRSRKDEHADTDVEEFITEAKNEWMLSDKHQFQAGMGITQNTIRLVEDTFDVVFVDIQEKVNRLHFFAQDQVSLGANVKLTGGVRFNYAQNIKKGFVDPRFSINFRTLGYLKFNLAWGRYHQFLVKSSLVDESGNYRYTWTIADEESIPVMTSVHWVAGAAWSKDKFTASIDGYYKETDGLTRYIRYQIRDHRMQTISDGFSRCYGVDFYLKQDIGHHAVWASYSLGKTEELFSYFKDNDYRRAPQDQRHEFKLAGLLNVNRWHFSSNYVYGSGFPLYTNYLSQDYTEPDYNRVDVSLTYKLSSKKFTGEVGFSVLNLLDADNVKYASFTKVPIDQINTVYINVESVGFTPLVYVKVGF